MARSRKIDLLEKSQEAMMSAVQIYNNPLIQFKSETYIVLAIIAWTYLLHAYYHDIKVDYRYYKMHGKRKKYDRTKYNAYKYWELERCLNDERCPLDEGVKNNLRFLIGIRHEIEHQKTNRIDGYISAKLQACSLNYNKCIVDLFGEKYCLNENLALAIQFSPIKPIQEKVLSDSSYFAKGIGENIKGFITSFESELTDEELKAQAYSYKVAYVPIIVNRANQADKSIQFVKADSAEAKNVERVLLKYREKPKFLPSQIVKIMIDEGFTEFTIPKHTNLWQTRDARNPKFNYGVKVAKQWYWYDNWVDEVRKHCIEKYK